MFYLVIVLLIFNKKFVFYHFYQRTSNLFYFSIIKKNLSYSFQTTKLTIVIVRVVVTTNYGEWPFNEHKET